MQHFWLMAEINWYCTQEHLQSRHWEGIKSQEPSFRWSQSNRIVITVVITMTITTRMIRSSSSSLSLSSSVVGRRHHRIHFLPQIIPFELTGKKRRSRRRQRRRKRKMQKKRKGRRINKIDLVAVMHCCLAVLWYAIVFAITMVQLP